MTTRAELDRTVPSARKALQFADAVYRPSGFSGVTVEDHAKLSQDAQNVLNQLAGFGNKVRAMAEPYGLKTTHTYHVTDEHPAALFAQINVPEAVKTLERAARNPRIGAFSKNVLLETAAALKNGDKQPGYREAMTIRPVKLAAPARVQGPTMSEDERLARLAWDQAPPARDWSGSPERRVYVTEGYSPYALDSDGPAYAGLTTVERAWTLEQFIRNKAVPR